MNEVIKQLKERKSVRAFTDRPITAEETAAMMALGLHWWKREHRSAAEGEKA